MFQFDECAIDCMLVIKLVISVILCMMYVKSANNFLALR